MRSSWILVLPLLGCVNCRFRAPDSPNAPNSFADPPARVARLSYLHGAVSFKAAGTDEWVAAALNRPLTTGDYLWTDRGTRAELSLGSAAIRLDSETGISFLNLDGRRIQIKLSEGAARVNVRAIEGDEIFEVDTPDAAVSLLRNGDYRVETNATRAATRVIVRAGLADAAGAAQSVVVRPNQVVLVGDRAEALEPKPAPPLDDFDMFCETRERRTANAAARAHVSRDVVGWEDLDEYGAWQSFPIYGPVWIPRYVGPGWAPYRFGHWVWIEPWGWTWVDDAPWGFAPFHYGRWIFLEARWCWVPGPIRVRAIYAPALVVFVGGGAPRLRYHVQIGAGIGIGWFPLGPREVYIPPYRASRVYITNVNISHTVIHDRTNIHGTDLTRQKYVNRHVPGAITAVPDDVFASGRAIGRTATSLGGREAAAIGVSGTAPPIPPARQSVSGDPGEGRRAPRPPDSVTRRPVVVREAPAPEQPSFERRRSELERDPGRAVDPGRLEEMRRQQPQPEYRRLPAPQRPAGQPQQRQAEPRPAEPRQDRRIEERARQDAERRRQTIDQEHQRQQQPAPRIEPRRGAERTERGQTPTRSGGESRPPRKQ